MSPERPRDRHGRPLPAGSADERIRDVEPTTIGEALERAAALFDLQRFFEAHEMLEIAWKSKEVRPAERRFWKGATQVAVGCCHVQRGNARGASSLLRRAAGNLEARTVRGVDGERLRRLALELAATVDREGTEAIHRFPRFPCA